MSARRITSGACICSAKFAADYILWRKYDGSQSGYDSWRANFGRTAASGTAVAAGHAVPEPICVALLAAGVTLLLAARRPK
jgi:hypothetical protein